MRRHLILSFGLVVGVLVLPHASGVIDRQPELIAPVVSLELRCEPSKRDTSELAVTLQNLASTDTAVVVGVTLANGRVYLPTALTLRARRPTDTREDVLPYANLVRIGGRVDSWIVPLPAGSSFVFSVPIRHFISSTAYTTEFKRFVQGGEALDVRVVLNARPIEFGSADLKLMNVWVGTLSSNQIHVPHDCIDGVARVGGG